MNRVAVFGLILVSVVFGSGCGGMKESFNYQTSVGARPSVARSCKTPLKVAVKPFKDARRGGEHGTESFTLSMFAGSLVATPARWELNQDAQRLKATSATYVHDDRRLYAIALWAELVDSGCFAQVAFDPRDADQYDLVFTGTIQRFGIMRTTSAVPLPLFVGNIIAMANVKQQALVEVDLYAYRPDLDKPVMSYGLQGFCDDECSENNWVDSVAKSLRSGHADFVARLANYLGSRSTQYWQEYQDRRARDRRLDLDSELVRLESALASESLEVRTLLTPIYQRKVRELDRILAMDSELEERWAKSSQQRVLAEIAAGNDLVDDVFSARLRAAIVAGIISAGAAGARGDTDHIASDMKSTQQQLNSASDSAPAPSTERFLNAKTQQRLRALEADRKQLPARRKREMARYRRVTGGVDSAIRTAREAALRAQSEVQKARLAEIKPGRKRRR